MRPVCVAWEYVRGRAARQPWRIPRTAVGVHVKQARMDEEVQDLFSILQRPVLCILL